MKRKYCPLESPLVCDEHRVWFVLFLSIELFIPRFKKMNLLIDLFFSINLQLFWVNLIICCILWRLLYNPECWLHLTKNYGLCLFRCALDRPSTWLARLVNPRPSLASKRTRRPSFSLMVSELNWPPKITSPWRPLWKDLLSSRRKSNKEFFWPIFFTSSNFSNFFILFCFFFVFFLNNYFF